MSGPEALLVRPSLLLVPLVLLASPLAAGLVALPEADGLPGPGAATGTDRGCGLGAPPTATSGEGPSGLVYAALKTGTRAVVAWTTEAPSRGTLSWSVSGGAVTTAMEPTERTAHVFVLDPLPRNETLCFTAGDGVPRAMRLANAMYAHDGDAYVLNLLVLGNELPDARALERGLDRYATVIHDATDGHVKSGRIVVLYSDPDHHNSGWTTCYVAVSFLTRSSPTCSLAADVIFTADAYPAGAASTYIDGIQDARQSIWMNSYWQAGTVNLGDDVGFVLAHEMGHYAFGGMDLYVGSGCNVYAKSLSVMSSARNLTEFDDEVNRCPNEAQIPGYVPTWTLIRQRFPLVPDRAGVIDAGPTTPGDAHVVTPIQVLPTAFAAPSVPQDDAGSGRDAPDAPTGEIVVAPRTWYVGTMGARDAYDHYAFHGLAGQTLNVTIASVPLCLVEIVDDEGAPLADACLFSSGGGVVHRVVLPRDGTWHIRVAIGPAYRFAYTLDAPTMGVAE